MNNHYIKLEACVNLTKEPKMIDMRNGNKIIKLSMVEERLFFGKDGEMKKKLNFFDCDCFCTPDAAQQYQTFEKGDTIFMHGTLILNSWEQNGVKRSRLVAQIDPRNFPQHELRLVRRCKAGPFNVEEKYNEQPKKEGKKSDMDFVDVTDYMELSTSKVSQNPDKFEMMDTPPF